MKKLFILTPAILLTAMLYSAADTSSITVNLYQKTGSTQEGNPIARLQFNQLNLNTETIESLTEKIYNKIYHSDELNHATFYSSNLKKTLPLKQVNIEIKQLLYRADSPKYNPYDSTTLSKAGIRNGQLIFAILEEAQDDIKEPGD